MDPDDIDDLLDEVESKFLKSKSGIAKRSDSLEELDFPHIASTSKKGKATPSPPLRSPRDTKQDSIEKAIDDICSISDPLGENSVQKKSDGSIHQRRCLPVYLGGSSVAMGLSSNVSQRACSNLLCTACDFHVCMFDDYVWDKTTDYLFLRNNIPDFDRLRKKLHHKKGWRAYACQCEQRSVNTLAEVKMFDLRWVCAKH